MQETKTAFVAIVGRPNVGKSSLLNALIGEKVAIVSNKPQTTRTRITGVLTRENTQFVFIDTPGLHKPRTKLSEYMVKQVNESVADVDVAVLVVEPAGEIQKAEQELIASFQAQRIPAILAINKIDTLDLREKLMPRILAFSQAHPFEAVVPISALKGDGVDAVLDELEKFAAPSPFFFDEDTLTDQPERVIVAEIVREKLLKNMYDEIPHGVAVTVERMHEREEQQLIDIEVQIYCEKESHKGMIIGKGGGMLKRVASQAREDIEHFLRCKVNLKCWVKVREDWRNRENVIRSFGFN
ncbi:GTPase Era [Anaerotruncus sp. 1XD42-93]|uniref:GTPase Era n=1 Tax=Anaerotruncus sp. 1XD42-93 TaxID=2320853 RepID=UPI000EA196E6|nr:GTPase Era [Anaerotruncus sp. 1XD42-93]NBK18707.1 GTPase Era [Anaerotruncus sp. 1XD42-93]RKJ84557.1 GTPase Era [Anaerotruncus sp. 1XD22-93]